MSVKVKLNYQNINLVKSIAKESLLKTADAIKTDLTNSQTLPFDTGELQNRSASIDDSKANKGKVTIGYDTPYARRLYYHPEYNFKKDKNKNAGGMWFEPYINGDKKDLPRKYFEKFMKGKV